MQKICYQHQCANTRSKSTNQCTYKKTELYNFKCSTMPMENLRYNRLGQMMGVAVFPCCGAHGFADWDLTLRTRSNKMDFEVII